MTPSDRDVPGLDRAGPIREGEELDSERLSAYLRDIDPSFEGPLSVEQFPGGHSNLTYLVRIGDRAFVLRRPPFGSKVKSAHDMGREFTVLSALSSFFPPAPRPIRHCSDPSILGAEFYLMERISGLVPRGDPPPGFEATEASVRRCCESFVDTLVELHSLDYREAGLADLRRPGRYTERQVLGWAKRYEGSKTDDLPELEAAAAWLGERIPEDSGAVVVHNDYKFDNLVLDPEDPTRIRGVLDWEMATIGDPLMDLGTTLAYWAEPGDEETLKTVQCFLALRPGAPSRREIADRYSAATGRDVSNVRYYYVFALFKVAVIVQQIYYRYKQGLTHDERFAGMIDMVRALGRKAEAEIRESSL